MNSFGPSKSPHSFGSPITSVPTHLHLLPGKVNLHPSERMPGFFNPRLNFTTAGIIWKLKNPSQNSLLRELRPLQIPNKLRHLFHLPFFAGCDIGNLKFRRVIQNINFFQCTFVFCISFISSNLSATIDKKKPLYGIHSRKCYQVVINF